MTILPNHTYEDALSWLYPPILQESWRNATQKRLSQALAGAPLLPVTDESRLVFLSDLHRGDGGNTDLFLPNKALFLRALAHYWRESYTYVEVGDGDELWMNYGFTAVRQAHGEVFDLLHQFHAARRLVLLYGNHDMRENGRMLAGTRPAHKDGLPTRESVLLHYQPGGQTILVCHGHQADLTSERLYAITRLTNRHFWRYLQQMGMAQVRIGGDKNHDRQSLPTALRLWSHSQPRRIEQRLMEWCTTHKQALICGHTHFVAWQEGDGPAYFNTGSGLQTGLITGLEIAQGNLHKVHWQWQGEKVVRQITNQRPLATIAAS